MYQSDSVALPSVTRAWPDVVRSAMVQVISLAHHALLTVHGWAANAVNPRARHKACIDRLRSEIALLQEEIRIKDARMGRIDAKRRPHYPPTERMAVLELKAARGWTMAQTARAFLLALATIASWLKRIDEEGRAALVRMREPINKLPDFVRYAVQRLKTLCPLMGKVKIAQMLARAGLQLGATTVGRMLKEESADPGPAGPSEAASKDSPGGVDATPKNPAEAGTGRIVTAKRPHHVWHVDLTVVPTRLGMWVPWKPLALPQVWPFCWWVAVAVDHFSRRAVGVAVFRKQPTSVEVRAFLGRSMHTAGAVPKYIITDRGSQFTCDGFKNWAKGRGVRLRFGAVGRYGSIAVVERFIRTMKDECTRRLVIPLRRETMRRELGYFLAWYNAHRPHTWLDGRTPNDVYNGNQPADDSRPPPQRAARSCCPHVALDVTFHAGRRHLPIVRLKRVA